MTYSLAPLLRALNAARVRCCLIGVGGANFYAPSGQSAFYTVDRDLFLPRDPANLEAAWHACERAGLELWSGAEPLDVPRDLWLAERVVALNALTRALGTPELNVDLTLVMAGFDFETIWDARREFRVEGEPIQVARLLHIVESKALANRPKDRMFLETHADALREFFREDGLRG